ncbi:MAG TPA: hypothetical protein VJU61_27615 [Polyangiaceae bacterium]|nr:hypothetical protein [Polyangiaceae bacterium]
MSRQHFSSRAFVPALVGVLAALPGAAWAQSEPVSSFGDDGTQLTEFFDDGTQELRAMVVQLDPATGRAKLVAAGTAAPTLGDGHFALARYERDGTPDRSFGAAETGRVITNFSVVRPEPPSLLDISSDANAVAVDRRQRVLAAGQVIFAGATVNCRFAVARYTADGRPDTTFGDLGRVSTDVNSACDTASAVVEQALPRTGLLSLPQARVVAGGTSGDPGTPASASSDSRFTLIGYHGGDALSGRRAGTLDASFGSGGIARSPHFVQRVTLDPAPPFADSVRLRVPITSTFDRLYALATQSDGKLIAVGSGKFSGIEQPVIARYTLDGSLDTSFADGGARVLAPSGRVLAVRVGSGDELFVSGRSTLSVSSASGGSDVATFVSHLGPDGELDPRFGTGGVGVTNVSVARAGGSPGFETVAAGLVVLPSGQILLGGSSSDSRAPFSSVFTLVRWTTDGQLDRNFGVDGVLRRTESNPRVNYAAAAAARLPDGRVVVGADSNRVRRTPPPALSWALAAFE